MTIPKFSKYLRFAIPEIVNERLPLLSVADKMETFIFNGKEGDVLNICMPTRFGKSLLATQFSVWYLCFVNPSGRLLRASYSSELALMFSKQVRAQYQKVFAAAGKEVPEISGTSARWFIDGRGEPAHQGVGIGSGLTGFGFDIAIIDDTAKGMLEAMSGAYRRQLESFRSSVLLGRLENERKIINVGTRWTVNDWFSLWSDADEYILPAVDESGHSVCEEWKSTEELQLERSRITDDVWQAQYLQRPTATGQVLIFEGWQPLLVGEVSEGKSVIVIDPATEYGRDYFVCGEYRFENGFVYLVDMYAKQRATIAEVADWLQRREYSVCYIESNGAGANITNELRRAGCRSLVGFTTNRDKYSRVWLQSEKVKNYLRIFAGINQEVLRELIVQAQGFPAVEHDDLIDNITMAFERLRI